MSNLQLITNKQETITSMEVSQMVGKEHSKLLRDIRRYCNQLGEAKIGFTDFFQETSYLSEQNKDIRDMFTLTVESIIDRLHITENTDTYSTRNIFDELAAKVS